MKDLLDKFVDWLEGLLTPSPEPVPIPIPVDNKPPRRN